jgi:iron complex outermembrane receptor protein
MHNKQHHRTHAGRKTLVAHALALAFGGSALALAGAAQAQAQAQGPGPELERVTVTGSNIPRTDKETASPVQVLSADDLKHSGYTSVSEVLREITANGNGTLSQSFSGAFATGASGISLRGLTVGATLVLIDGHRMAPYPRSDDGQRPFVDISAIPFSAVERIEILKDGASAVYGSDAIAGVVNVILKKTIQGTTISADAGDTSHGGGANSSVAIAHGFGTLSDAQNGFISLEYKRSSAIALNQRSGDWTRLNWTAEGGLDRRPGAAQLPTSLPNNLTPYLQRPGSSSTDPTAFVFLNNNCNFTQLKASQCAYTDFYTNLQPPTENLNLIGRFNARLGNEWDMNITASYFDSKSKISVTPNAIPVGSFAGITAIGPGLTPTIVNAISPFTVPANYPGNTLGVAANVRGFFPIARTTDSDAKSTRLVAELNGTLGGWDFKGSAGYTRVEQSLTYNGFFNFPNLYAALNNPNALLLLTGGNSAAQMASIFPTVHNLATDSLGFIDARITKELMQLDGGPLGMGLGVGYFHKDLNAPDPVEVQMGLMGINGAYAVGRESNTNVFMELAAPVAKTLELDGALRVDHYDTYGTSTTPKFGFKFTPAKEFALRGTVSEGFRAPAATENGNAGSVFLFSALRDPQLCPTLNANGTPNITAANNVPLFCNFTPAYLQGTSAVLQPEKSKSFTLGAIFEPVPGWSSTLDYYRIKIDNQIISAAATPSFNPTDFTVRSAPQQVVFGDGRTGLSPVGPIAYINTPYVNAQSTETTGMEFDTRYKFKLADASSLAVDLQLTHLFSYELSLAGQPPIQLAGTHGPSAVGGDTGSPKNRAQLTLAYTNGPLTLTSNTSYISSFDVTDPSAGLNTCLLGITSQGGTVGGSFGVSGKTPPAQYCTIPSFTYTNVTAAYKFGKGLTLRAGITNLFDKAPPVDLGTYGGTGTTPYNPSMHQIGAVGRAYSLGLDYSF